jgi:hypothetical protein
MDCKASGYVLTLDGGAQNSTFTFSNNVIIRSGPFFAWYSTSSTAVITNNSFYLNATISAWFQTTGTLVLTDNWYCGVPTFFQTAVGNNPTGYLTTYAGILLPFFIKIIRWLSCLS